MGEDDSVFRVWIVLLATCRADGISPVSEIFLKTITGKDEAEVDRCLKVLSNPDPRSRSDIDDGRRIRRIDGGFEIINYQKYRERTPTDYERERKQAQRAKNGDCPGQSGTVPGRSASPSASASGVKGSGEKGKSKNAGKHLFKNSPFYDFEAFVAGTKWKVDKARHYYQSAEEYSESKNAMYANWVMAVRNWARRDEAEGKGYYHPKRSEQRMKERRRAEKRIPIPVYIPDPDDLLMNEEDLNEFKKSTEIIAKKIGRVM